MTPTARDLVTGTAFTLSTGTPEGGYGTVWGRGAITRFDGREGDLTLEGEVANAMLGADVSHDAAMLGLMLSHAWGDGSYQGEGEGEVESTVTGLYPYGRWALNDRVSLWGVAGYGEGTLLFRRLFRERLTGLFRRVGAGISHIVLVLPDGLVGFSQAMA